MTPQTDDSEKAVESEIRLDKGFSRFASSLVMLCRIFLCTVLFDVIYVGTDLFCLLLG